MATRMCDVCGIRPAVVTVRRVVPGDGQRVEHLCEIHAAEAGVGHSTFGGSSPLGGGSLFDDFFDKPRRKRIAHVRSELRDIVFDRRRIVAGSGHILDRMGYAAAIPQ